MLAFATGISPVSLLVSYQQCSYMYAGEDPGSCEVGSGGFLKQGSGGHSPPVFITPKSCPMQDLDHIFK